MWALLPSDVIIAVAERLPIADYARFRSVCTAWSSALKDFHSCTHSSFPWLYTSTLLSFRRRYTKSTRVVGNVNRSLSFLNCSEGRYYHLSLPADISAAGTSVRLIGHRDGWMVLLLDDDLLMPVVVNPLSGTQLPLPSLRTLPCMYRYDFSYTLIPYPARNVAFVIYSFSLNSGLALAGPGDERWTHVSSHDGDGFNDVFYHDGRFYAAYPSGKMLAFELELFSSGTKACVVAAENKYLTGPYVNFTRDMFLVSSPSGDLLQIRMVKYSSDLGPDVVRRPWHRRPVKSFVVMKYDADADGWVEIKDLGDSCIFVDKSQAMLLPAEDNDRVDEDEDLVDDPAWPRPRRNCIYFAGSHRSDRHARRWDVRVYEVGSIAQGNPCSSLQFYEPIFWFRPSFP